MYKDYGDNDNESISAVDGAEALVGARAGGDQAEDPERQVPPSA